MTAAFTWSYSQLKNYETCAKRYLHYNVAKDVKEPESDQLRTGNELHAAFEARLKRSTPLPFGLTHHEPLLEKIIAAPGETHGEQKLGLTSSFVPTGFFSKQVWLRVVIDAVKINDTYATVLDYKTGKPSEDITQLQIFAATIFHHQPRVQRVRSALVFVNHEHIEKAEFVREDVTEIWSEILPRVKKLEQARAAQEYPPNPSGLCKKYCSVVSCPYHGKGG
jgi:hypothetical protein